MPAARTLACDSWHGQISSGRLRFLVGSAQTKPRGINRVVGFAQVKEEPEGRGTRSKTRYPIDTKVTMALSPPNTSLRDPGHKSAPGRPKWI
ncbi:MAG: hypothetical protein V4858_28875 [Pseudomonadota bacterium]